jgi:8-oxo-dGTP pyrophosphatase MutT (NUDIX family)
MDYDEDAYWPLNALYGPAYTPIVRNGRCYPVAIVPWVRDRVMGTVRYSDEEAPIDADLLRWGENHRRQLAGSHRMHDGVVVVLKEIVGDTLYAARSGYFAMLSTCDALRAEYLKGRFPWPLRARANRVAGPEGPVRSGKGRAAAIGVSVVTVLREGGHRGFLLGRRRPDLAMDGGAWQLAPSGMVEPAGGADLVIESVRRELAEELGLYVDEPELVERLCPLGVAVDLLRLRPEICVRLDMAQENMGTGALRVAGEEFTSVKFVELSGRGLGALWSAHSPYELTPAAAGAIALLERSQSLRAEVS